MFKKISAIICVFILTLFITGCGGKNSSKSLVSNTTWVDKYDSEFVFTENRLSNLQISSFYHHTIDKICVIL